MSKTSSQFDVLEDDLYMRTAFHGAFSARMFGDGVVLNRTKLVMGLPVPLIMERSFESYIKPEVAIADIEKLALRAGVHLSMGYLLDQMIKEKRAEVRGFENWVRKSKLHLGLGDV
jgi:hypothetical protein